MWGEKATETQEMVSDNKKVEREKKRGLKERFCFVLFFLFLVIIDFK